MSRGTTVLRWLNQGLPRGMAVLRWLNQGLGKMVTMLGASLGPQVVSRVCSVPKLYP
jgi:hypothetical protein